MRFPTPGVRNVHRTYWIWAQECSQLCSIFVMLSTGFGFHFIEKLKEPEYFLWVDAICMYSYRTATKCCRNLRFRPQFCEGFGFASHCLDSNPQKPVRAPFWVSVAVANCNPQHVSAKPASFAGTNLDFCPACCNGFRVSVIPKVDNFALRWSLSKEDVGPLNGCKHWRGLLDLLRIRLNGGG
jgi:hypothetical protein